MQSPQVTLALFASKFMDRYTTPSPGTANELAATSPTVQSMFDIMPGWIWETDSEHRFTYLSKNRDLYEHSAYDAIGDSRLELFEKRVSQTEEVKDHIRDIEAHRPFSNFVYLLETIQGRAIWICTNGTPSFSEDGTFQGYRGFAMQVTPIMDAAGRAVAAEQALLKRNAVLEERVAERTQELETLNNRLSDIVEGMDHGVLFHLWPNRSAKNHSI